MRPHSPKGSLWAFCRSIMKLPYNSISSVVGEILTDCAHYQKWKTHSLRRVRYTNASKEQKEYFNLRKEYQKCISISYTAQEETYFKPPRPKSLGSVSSGVICCYSGSVTDRGEVREEGEDKFHIFGVSCRSTTHRNGKRHKADRQPNFLRSSEKVMTG